MPKKGRDKQLIERRNRKLVERYYYWTEVKRRRFDDVLETLSNEEFFISESRILVLLRENNEQLNELIAEKQKTNQLSLFNQN